MSLVITIIGFIAAFYAALAIIGALGIAIGALITGIASGARLLALGAGYIIISPFALVYHVRKFIAARSTNQLPVSQPLLKDAKDQRQSDNKGSV